ncbi:unnamed protein product [Adineta steineri]|uniref:Uncharacterized protein n=1 Tax=Adineta steineri TaxID=433720 RepID=A0A818YN71_9BILA|nr:unnamed protein product [Adineta steineri]CAF3756232.1 unnamed protein product [Adineta steineri]
MIRTNSLQQAVANESAKYHTRLPAPTTWRLKVSRVRTGTGKNPSVKIVYYLIIDIGRPGRQNVGNIPYQYNQVNPYPPPYTQQQNTIPSARSTAAFCAQCGAPRQNPSMRFCSSCGQAFTN